MRKPSPRLVVQEPKPESPGPSPAVVLLHGCDGSWRGIDRRWGTRLQSWGYVTLAVDSYGPRGITNTCSVPIGDDTLDGYAALNFLADQTYVDGNKVALLGTSRGGGLTLTAVEQGAFERLSKTKFKAAVALYPPCVGDSGLVTDHTHAGADRRKRRLDPCGGLSRYGCRPRQHRRIASTRRSLQLAPHHLPRRPSLLRQ